MNTNQKSVRRKRALAYLSCPLILHCFLFSAFADRVDLVNGSFVDGKILEESAQGVRIEYNTTATIKDTKFIPQAEIKKVTREGLDDVEYRELNKLFPLPDFLKNEEYIALIERKLKPFKAKFPASKRLSDVQRLIETAEAERAKVAAGSLKVNAKWITPQEYEKDKYNYDALVLISQMKRMGAEGKYNEAMRIFDKVSSDFGVSAHYPTAVEEVKKILVVFNKTIKQMLKESPVIIAQREKALAGLTDTLQKTKVTEAIKLEKNTLAAARAEEKAAGHRWLSYDKYDLATVEETSKMIQEFEKTLSQYNTSSFARYSPLVRDAMRAVKERRFDDVPNLVKVAGEAGAPKEILEKITKEVETLKADAQKAATPSTPVPMPSSRPAPPVTPASPTDPDMAELNFEATNAVARSLAKQQAEADAAKAAAKPIVPPEPSLADKAKEGAANAVTTTPEVTPSAPPKSDAATKPTTPANAAPTAAAAPASPALVIEEESGVSPFLIGGAGAAVLLVGLLIYQKKRKKLTEDEDEDVTPEPESESDPETTTKD